MPLRDHFHPPLSRRRRWESFHASWPTMIVDRIFPSLPEGFIAEPRVHLGPLYEIDIATFDEGELFDPGREVDEGGGVATAVWAPPRPTFAIATDRPDQSQFEVRVYDIRGERRLVAAIELISPANKDRPEKRREFVAKCAALVFNQVCVTIVDVVTERSGNIYEGLMDWFGLEDPALAVGSPSLYAATCRWVKYDDAVGRLETWSVPLAIGETLRTLPLWLDVDKAIPLDLETSYEATLRILHIP